jgi:hypothetical protein
MEKNKTWLVKLKENKRGIVWALLAFFAVAGVVRFTGDAPVDYSDETDHFKYGSLGSEYEFGIPYWVWKALPEMFPDKLPGGYAALGFVFEPGKDLPIGMSKRRVLGMDRVWLNCAFCHAGTVRKMPDDKPQVVIGMPANTFDFHSFTKFFLSVARDRRFTPQRILHQIDAMGGDLDFIDRALLRFYGLYFARERMLTLADRLDFLNRQPAWGPGRVDTFNPLKIYFGFPMDKLPKRELIGTTDFPSIWNQQARDGMQLHWDGNNTSLEERNKSAALGTGVTPVTIDLKRLARAENWVRHAKPPAFPFPIDKALAAQGAPVYQRYCASCHGKSGADFSGEYVGKVVPIEEIKTDRHRLDSYTFELNANQNTLYAGYPWRFKNFRKTFGYANQPLDGLWLRAPYLHNGSVPTLSDLLEPAAARPKVFYRGNDLYDPTKLGFVTTAASEKGRPYFKFDTSVDGNGNAGHEGARYGTELPREQKRALVEYLKTF